MGGFENQRVGVTFAGVRYEIDLDAPAEIYRKFFALPKKFKTENDWNKVKVWIVEFIAFYNDVNKKKLKESLTKSSVIKFINAYNNFLTEATDEPGGSKKVKNQKKMEN